MFEVKLKRTEDETDKRQIAYSEPAQARMLDDLVLAGSGIELGRQPGSQLFEVEPKARGGA